MEEYRATLSGSSSEELFAKMPPDVKDIFVEGLAALPNLSREDTEKLIAYISDNYYSQTAPDFEILGDVLSISRRTAQSLGTITALAIGVAVGTEDVEKFTESAKKFGVLADSSTENTFRSLVALLSNRSKVLTEKFRASSLATQILPSFASLQTTLDVRLRFEKGKVANTVPVIVAHLDTDIDGEHLWFQLKKSDLQRLTSQLEKLLTQLDEAEKWSASR